MPKCPKIVKQQRGSNMDLYKYPQTYILLRAPFHLLKQESDASEAFRLGALELIGPSLTPDSLLIEVTIGRMPAIAELDFILERELEMNMRGRSALFIWGHDDPFLHIEAALHNALDFLKRKAVAHIVCFLQPNSWGELSVSARARLRTTHTCFIDPPGDQGDRARVPILAIRSAHAYTPVDKEAFSLYLKGEYPPSATALSTERPRGKRDGETTIEFNVSEVAPGLLKDDE